MLNQKTILLVEDNADDELLTIRALKKNNMVNKIFVAHDGVEALDFLLGPDADTSKEIRPLPALIILDLKLPRIDGLEVLKRIKSDARTKLIPVVVLTSSDEKNDVLASYEIGANSFIRKPTDFLKFVEMAGYIVLYWFEINESPIDIVLN
jgi:two-component system response regulator